MGSSGVSIGANNRGPWINIVTWILLVTMCLATFTKIFSKRVMAHKLQHDDAYIVAATLVTAGYDVAISSQVSAGVGRHLSSLSIEQVTRYQQVSRTHFHSLSNYLLRTGSSSQKSAYASQILYVVSLSLAKVAILQFLLSLARINTRRLAVKGLMIFILISVVISTIAIAFQCPLPRPWAIFSNRCFNQAAFWDAWGIMDALVDLATFLLPIYLLHDLQMAWSRKIPVMVSFASRALLIPIIIVRLVYLNSASNSVDQPFHDFAVLIISSVHANLSVIVTCIPFIKPVMDSLQTGILASDVHTTTSAQHPGYALRWLGSRSGDKVESGFDKWRRNRMQGNSTTATSGTNEEQRERGLSVGSEERMIIKQTKTISVETMKGDTQIPTGRLQV